MAKAINDGGDVAGWSYTSEACCGSTEEAVVWHLGGTYTVLQDVGGRNDSWATAINSAGYVVGQSLTGNNEYAVRWAPDGTGTILPDFEGGGTSVASAINTAGEVVGYYSASQVLTFRRLSGRPVEPSLRFRTQGDTTGARRLG